MIYPIFLAPIFHECFISKERYFFHDVATNWAPLYYCIRWYLNTEGQPTMRRTTCRLLRLLSRNTRIRITRITRIERMQSSHKGNYKKLHSSSNARPRIPFQNIRNRCSFANRNWRPCKNEAGNNKMDRSTNYTTCSFPLMRRYCTGAHIGPAGISFFHTVVTAGFTAQQQW